MPNVTTKKREKLASSQDWLCFWCKQPMVIDTGFANSATVEHLIPKSKGGSNALENLRAACYRCNQQRRDIPADEFALICHRFTYDTEALPSYDRPAKIRERIDRAAARQAVLSGIKDNPFEVNSRRWRQFEKIKSKINVVDKPVHHAIIQEKARPSWITNFLKFDTWMKFVRSLVTCRSS